MTVKEASPCLAFDVDAPLSGAQAAEFIKAGYSAVARYIPRLPALGRGDLTALEIQILLTAGLSVFCVQHVGADNWKPSASLGTQYGQYAGFYAEKIGLPKGVSIFLDLEMVSPSSTPEQCIDYCTAWYNEVHLAGYAPGVYCGYQTGLSDQQLYDLPFASYWRAYNCDQNIPTRGYCIIQEPAKGLGGISFDPNRIQADNLGGLPIFLYGS
jgi:Domain of unknown function (DUF1906)